MATIQALRKEAPPPRSPEREHLREAIAKREASEQQLIKVKVALEKADAASSDTFRSLKQAKAMLEEARAYERYHLVATALGEGDAGVPVSAAQAALDKAQRNHDAASKLVDALRAEQANTEDRLMWATQDVSEAVRAVLKASPEVERLRNDVEIVKGAFAHAVSKLLSLPPGVNGTVSWDIRELLSKTPDSAWSAATSALATNADAELPTS